MLLGETVIVKRPVIDGRDTHGNPLKRYESETVNNVLINTPTTADLRDNTTEQDGVTASFTLAFPIHYTKSLKDCQIIMPWLDSNTTWYVIGDPKPLPLTSFPHQRNRWNMKALVTEYGG